MEKFETCFIYLTAEHGAEHSSVRNGFSNFYRMLSWLTCLDRDSFCVKHHDVN